MPRRFASPQDTSRLERLAYRDGLTGLANRARLTEALHHALAGAGENTAVALLSIDLDDFKLVNDGLGHLAGDVVLREVAARFGQALRADDLLARNGGDEFAVLMEVRDGPHHAAELVTAVANRITAALESPFRVGDAEFHVGASIGASLFPFDADGADALQRHADAAMYAAKEGGGGFEVYRSGAPSPLTRLSLATRMRSGLSAGAFRVAYQPIYRLPDPTVIGVEALLRWSDDGRAVPPDEFIGVAERTGVIHELGLWVLDAVCRQAATWDADGLHPNFGVNVSPVQLLRAGFPERFASTVRAHGLQPSRIVVELTETAWTVDAARTLPALAELAAAGFVLALDDFGAGYSSLSRLRRLPVDVIKVDRAFMTDLPDDPQAVAVVDAIFGLAHACHCDVVVEGVETDAQLAFVTDRGCRLAQGFGLARPQDPAAMTALLRRDLAAERRS